VLSTLLFEGGLDGFLYCLLLVLLNLLQESLLLFFSLFLEGRSSLLLSLLLLLCGGFSLLLGFGESLFGFFCLLFLQLLCDFESNLGVRLSFVSCSLSLSLELCFLGFVCLNGSFKISGCFLLRCDGCGFSLSGLLLGVDDSFLLLFLSFFSSPVLFYLLDSICVHLELVLVTPACFVFSWGGVDALEVLFATLHASCIVGIIDCVWSTESIKEVFRSITFSFDHLEN